jgi:hypothetical protein
MKNKFKNKRVISILVLLAYLGVFSANVYHFHNINFVFTKSGVFNTSTTLKFSLHNFENCIVQSTFNSVHSVLIKSSKVAIIIEGISNLAIQDLTLPAKNYLISSLKFRAPPFQHS